MYAVVKRVAPTASMVLIEGETGTGKELVAGAIHALSGRSGPFVPVNCGSISPELLESELFGHTKGAFTSAHSSREGLFSYAQDGTLFLDEISEMSLAMQAKLLRALEEKRVRPVGADREVPVNARVIAATNRQLAIEMSEGNFREDLFFRLNVLAIMVPPLREHSDDIPALASHFSSLLASELGVEPIPFAHEDIVQMQAYGWPGNVRELKNVIERSLLLGKLPGDFFAGTAASMKAGAGEHGVQGMPLSWSLDEVEKHHMLRVLESSAGNKSRAARSLGVSRKTLERKLKSWSEI
jgi:two-component system NtrC family response regulator